MFTPQQVMDKAIKDGTKFQLTNNRTQLFRSRVNGEWRLEIAQPNSWYLLRSYPDIIYEKIQYRDRYFIPVGDKGIALLEKLLADNPVRNTAEEELTQYQSREYLEDESKPRKKALYNEEETRFMIWANGSAPVGEVKSFYRFKKLHFYEKTEDYCVELSRAQYDEKRNCNVKDAYRQANSEISQAANRDEGSGGTGAGNLDSDRNGRAVASVSGQVIGEELRDETRGSVPSGRGNNQRAGLTDDEQHQQRTNTLNDREVLVLAANHIKMEDLTDGE